MAGQRRYDFCVVFTMSFCVLESKQTYINSPFQVVDISYTGSGKLVGSVDRASSQQLQIWFSEHFSAPKLAA